MKKLVLIIVAILILVSGILIFYPSNNNSLKEARIKAQEAAQEINATLTGNYEQNNYTNTIWFELKDATSIKSGCDPVSVYNVNTRKAEINWRCTGLLPPK